MKKTIKIVSFIVFIVLIFGGIIYVLEQFSPMRDELSGYTTTLSARSHEQVDNITRAAHALNNVIIKPGQVFSFNHVVGPYTVAKGYRNAPLIVDREYVENIGGGLCQVSSTLYNAVLLANLEIVKRVAHQFKIASVPAGRFVI